MAHLPCAHGCPKHVKAFDCSPLIKPGLHSFLGERGAEFRVPSQNSYIVFSNSLLPTQSQSYQLENHFPYSEPGNLHHIFPKYVNQMQKLVSNSCFPQHQDFKSKDHKNWLCLLLCHPFPEMINVENRKYLKEAKGLGYNNIEGGILIPILIYSSR